jgi:acyl-CoA thioesterase I
MSRLEIKPHNVILFQGDSITDAGRSRQTIGPNNPDGLGYGYPRLITEQLLAKFPDHFLQIYNRGVSGDQIRDLSRRWQNDSLRLLPDIISILIGVNDTWNYLYLGQGSDPNDYQKVYREILQDTRQQLPDTRFVLCEPFVLITGEVSGEWLNDISKRQQITRELARDFNGVIVPFQSTLDTAAKDISPSELLEDGVHPTDLGHNILADCWIEAVLG